jgi:hypothetical protein
MTMARLRTDIPKEAMEQLFARGGTVDVVLTINGVEVPFVEALEKTWNMMSQRFDEEVANAANKRIGELGRSQLDDFDRIIGLARDDLKTRLQQLCPSVNFNEN